MSHPEFKDCWKDAVCVCVRVCIYLKEIVHQKWTFPYNLLTLRSYKM